MATISDNEAALPKCVRRLRRRLLEMTIISIRANYKFCRERRCVGVIPLLLLRDAGPISLFFIRHRT
jgi:hypothetical protein